MQRTHRHTTSPHTGTGTGTGTGGGSSSSSSSGHAHATGAARGGKPGIARASTRGAVWLLARLALPQCLAQVVAAVIA